MSEAIGMMEGAFFVPRSEILSWINSLLKLELTKIEQTCSGAIACQIMDAISPGTVPMHKVNWAAKHEYEYVANYKVLQQVFLKLGLKKEIEVEKLIKGKYQDNLEFMQWMKRYYDMHANTAVVYDAVARRKCAPTANPQHKVQKPPAKPAVMSSKDVMPSAKKALMAKENKMVVGPAATVPATVCAAAVCAAPQMMPPPTTVTYSYKSAELIKEITAVKGMNSALQKERDFYFGKLRDLEILVHFHEKEKTPLVECIEKILYATEDDKIVIDDKGNLRICSDTEMEDKPVEMTDAANKGQQVEVMQE